MEDLKDKNKININILIYMIKRIILNYIKKIIEKKIYEIFK